MTKNMGTIDRSLRIVIALVVFAWAFSAGASATMGVVFCLAIAAGVVMLLTALLGNCPLYQMLGLKTCRTEKTHGH